MNSQIMKLQQELREAVAREMMKVLAANGIVLQENEYETLDQKIADLLIGYIRV